MGWVTELAPGHEGWVAMVVDDGREGSCSSRDGVVFFLPGGGEEVVPWDRVVAWRGRCECGWVGPELPAEDDLREADGRPWRDCPEDVADRVFIPAWEDHVAVLGHCGNRVDVEGVTYVCRLSASHDGRHEEERPLPGDSRVLRVSWDEEDR